MIYPGMYNDLDNKGKEIVNDIFHRKLSQIINKLIKKLYLKKPANLKTKMIEFFYLNKNKGISKATFNKEYPILVGDERNSVVIATKILREFLFFYRAKIGIKQSNS